MAVYTSIEAVVSELPRIKITSEAIEEQIALTMKRLDIPKRVIVGLTGIVERRLWEPGFMPSDAATKAALKVIDMAGVDPNEIGCLINTSVCKDYIEPSVASLVHGNLGLPAACMNFDICNACLGFINGIEVISMMIQAEKINYGLLVNAESSREPLEATIKRLQAPDVTAEQFRENFATLTLGSGAAAMLLCRSDLSASGHMINGGVSLAATRHCRLCLGQKDSMVADAPSVMKYGVELAGQTWEKAGAALENWSDKGIDIYIPHQVSARNTRVLSQALGLSMEKMHLNFQALGNIGPAAVPITLSMADQENRIRPGDHVALLGIGSGLNCSMMSVTW